MVLVREEEEPPAAVGEDGAEPLVEREVAVPDLGQHGLRDDNVAQRVTFVLEEIHLVQHDVGVQHEVLRGARGEPRLQPGLVELRRARGQVIRGSEQNNTTARAASVGGRPLLELFW